MKKLLSVIILSSLISVNAVFAADIKNNNTNTSIDVPKWEDYVPEKYQNPRDDFSKGGSVAEMVVGILTAPLGIPFIIHSATKLKNISYSEKKIKFENGLKTAETISDLNARQQYYKQLIEYCGLQKKSK